MTSRTSTPSNANASRRGPAPSSLALSSSNLSNSPSNSTSNLQVPSTVHHPKATITVEEWERRAPLSELQVRSVARVMKAAEKIPLPLKFADEPNAKSSPATPIPGHLASKHLLQVPENSRPGTPGGSSRTPPAAHALHPSHPVQTPQQFYDWFALIDRSVAHSQEAHYRAHVASLEEHLGVCDLLLRRIGEVEAEVDAMLEGWRGVEEGGKSLKGACERLLEERDGLLELMEDIGGHLEYFQELEHATRMLNHPGESLIFQADFLYMVERVDICIDFLKGHRHYREAEVYLLRFQQCMTRAMTLIRMNFVGSLRALSAEISKRLSEKDVSPTAQQHLLYTRFRSVSTRVAPLLGELERRAQVYPDDLGALLAECRAAYFSTRKGLLVPRIMEEIRGLDPSRSELVELTRSGCSYLKQLCTDEFNLYREFFSTAEDQLYQYLETLCDLLYDDLRPRILHEPRLTVLCEVCTVLQALMVLDASVTSSTTVSEASESSESSSAEDDHDHDHDGQQPVHRHPPRLARTSRRSSDSSFSSELTIHDESGGHGGRLGKRLHTGHLLKMVLQDAQTRLFFKAQAVIQSEIRHYVPRPEDLAWPDVLVAANKPPSSTGLLEPHEKESTSQIFANVPALSRQDTWYPTLRKTVWVLAQLHDFVKPAIFEDMAQEALGVCKASLVGAGEMIRTRGGPNANAGSGSSALDGALFVVRHLLILKEVLGSLEVDLRAREGDDEGGSVNAKAGASARAPGSSRPMDFGSISTSAGGGVTETLTNMLSKTTSLLPEGLFASLGVTRGVESDMRGVKMDIDQSLRKACEDVIAACAQPICDPLDNWVGRVDTLKTVSASGGTDAPPPPAVPVPPTGSDASGQPTPPQTLHALASEAPQTHLRFLEALQRDLRAAVARVRLYLEDERTVRVLLEHVVDRVGGAYERFGEGIGTVGLGGRNGTYGREGQGEEMDMLSPSRLREILRDVCGDSSLSFAPYGRA